MMKTTIANDVMAHTCFYCEGIWLSEEAFKAVEIDSTHRHEIEKLFENPDGINKKSKTRKCPKCTGKYLDVIFNNRMELDRCSKCRGIFFDKGELTGEDLIIEKSRKSGLGDFVAMEGAFWALFIFFGN